MRITSNTPSYWHGWSPDGSTLVYCARRNGQFEIFTIDTGGGEELQLTTGAGHNDGPDYSPDGQWIWFNSDADGSMDLWRMHTDGSALQRITDDRVNWISHPSPDGRWVLYLAYESNVTGHPRNEHVELRLIDLAGNSTETLVSLFSGQGSINVPCWSPDNKEFAFMRFEREVEIL